MGIIEITGQLINFVLGLNTEILLLLIFVFVIISFKVFGFLLRVVLTGVVFGAFPIVAYLLGIPVPLTLNSIISYAFLGIVVYFAYGVIRFGFKAVKVVLSPFKRSFSSKREVTKKPTQ